VAHPFGIFETIEQNSSQFTNSLNISMNALNECNSIASHSFFSRHLPDIVLDNKQEVTEDEVEIALGYASMKVYSQYDVLTLLSSLNLLNAAIKNKRYKHMLQYQTIKGHVARVIGYCITTKGKNFLDELFIKKEEGYCAYVRCLGLQFSFHNIGLNNTIRSFIDSPENVINSWDTIRLQPIAPAIFRKALELRLKNTLGSKCYKIS
jgi:hypothetical protein